VELGEGGQEALLVRATDGPIFLEVRVPAERERPDRSNVNAWIGAT
jgi:hypothetical protein